MADQLRGPKGDTGVSGLPGIQAPPGFSIGSVYPTASNPNAGGTIGGITYFGSKEFSTETLTVSGASTLAGVNMTTLTVSGTTTLANLNVSTLTASGNGVFAGTGSSSFAGSLDIAKGLRASNFTQTGSGVNYFGGTVSIPLLAATTGLPCLTTNSLGVVGTMACDTASVSVDSYGAIGDGVTDDSNAFLLAIATGKNISLTNSKTYLISKQLNISTGQNIYGNGATIKRANQVTTTTTTTITSGVTNTITVADASLFVVGQSINILNGTTYDQSNRVIASIVGNVITLTTALSLNGGTPQDSVSGTTNVFLSFYVMGTTGTNGGVHDLTIDGNKSNYSFYRWETAVEIYIHGTNNIIEHNTLTNPPGEGIGAYTDYATVQNNTVTGSNGNPIHLSGTNHPVIDGNRLVNGNLDPIVGHADGCVTFSNTITHVTITNNYMENCISGVGSLDSADNSDVTIANNTIKSMTTTAIEGLMPNASIADLVITGNRIYDSQSVSFNETIDDSSGFPNRVIFSNNYLSNTPIYIMRSQYITISNNTIDDSTSTTVIPLSIYSSQQISVTGNTIIGGDYGIYVANGTGTTTDVLINGNTLTNQYHNAIDLNSASMNNVQATNNTISATATSASTYDGMIIAGGSVARGNTINIAVGHACINAGSSSIIRGNRCTHGAATYSIFASGGTSGIVIENNDLDLAVSNSSGNTNFLSDNNIGTTAGLWLNNFSGGLYTNDLSLSFGASGRVKTITATTTSSPYDVLALTSNGSTAGWKGVIDLNVSYNAGTAVNGLRVVANTDGTTANVGIGTQNVDAAFELTSAATTTNVASISATALTTGAAFSIRVPASTSFSGPILVATDVNGLVLASLSSGGRFSIRRTMFSHGADTTNCTGVGVPSSGCIDYAENMPTDDTSITAGDIVAVSGVNMNVIKSQGKGDGSVLGIVSTNPAALITGNTVKLGDEANSYHQDGFVPVALAGRVPVKTSLENGPIQPGDKLTASSIPGIAMKATQPGQIVGTALEPLAGLASGSYQKIMTFVNVGYWAPSVDSVLASASMDPTLALQTTTGSRFTLSTLFDFIIEQFKQIGVTIHDGMVSAHILKADQLCAGDTCVTEDQLKALLNNANIQPAASSTPTPSATPTPEPEASPIPSESPTPTSTPEPEVTPEPTATPEPTPEI